MNWLYLRWKKFRGDHVFGQVCWCGNPAHKVVTGKAHMTMGMDARG